MNAKIVRSLLKVAPTVLTAISTVGTLATAYFSHEDTKRAMHILDNYKSGFADPNVKIPIKDEIRITGKCYWRTALSVAITIASGIAANRLSAAQIATLTATVGYLAADRKQIVENLRGELSSSHANEIIGPKHLDSDDAWWTPSSTIEETGKGDTLCFESFSGRWFYSSIDEVDLALKHIRERFRDGEYLCMNDLYKELGICVTSLGYEFGWPNNGDFYNQDLEIDADMNHDFPDPDIQSIFGYSGEIGTGREVYVISIYDSPMLAWQEF